MPNKAITHKINHKSLNLPLKINQIQIPIPIQNILNKKMKIYKNMKNIKMRNLIKL